MAKNCSNCKHALDLNNIVDYKKTYACKEAFYYKTKYDNLKSLKLTCFIPVVDQDTVCSKFEKNT